MKDAGTAARTCVRDGWDSDEVAMSVDSFAGAGRLQEEEVRTRERSIEKGKPYAFCPSGEARSSPASFSCVTTLVAGN